MDFVGYTCVYVLKADSFSLNNTSLYTNYLPLFPISIPHKLLAVEKTYPCPSSQDDQSILYF